MTDIETILSDDGDTQTMELSETLLTLQHQLQTSIQLASQYKSENETLKSQLQDAHNLHSSMSNRYSEWRELWKKELERVDQREKNLKREEEKWKNKVEEKKREMAEFERRTRENLDGIGGIAHSGVVKDMESELNVKIDKISLEANNWRERFYASRKDYECLQAKCDEFRSQTERQKKIAQAFQNEILSLQNSFANKIRECGDDSDSKRSHLRMEERVRELKRQLDERSLLVEKLNEEVKEAMKSRDDEYIAKQELIATHQTEMGQLNRLRTQLETTNQTLERRLAATEKELAETNNMKNDIEEEINCANRELGRLREALKSDASDHVKVLELERKKHSHIETELNQQLSKTKAMLEEEQSKSKDLENQIVETRDNASRRIQELVKELDKSDDSKENYLVARNQIAKLEIAVANLKDEKKQNFLDSQAEIERLKHACESCHKEANLAMLEKTDLQKTLEVEKARSEQWRRDLEECERSIIKFEEKNQIVSDEKRKLVHQLENVESEKKVLEQRVNVLNDAVASAKDDVKNIKERSDKEIAAANAALESEVDKVKEQLAKEKWRSNAYKEKALQAHERNVKAKDLLESLRNCD
mmetsp:Transcript_17199/g.36354  ORF Transcript_17199/g.36354 Transcript_17199/m.36354 type:complete len:593 (-) Transcript_17199:529-2307(-)